MKSLITSLLILQAILLSGQASVEPNYFLLGRDNLPSSEEMVTDTFMFYDNGKGALRGGFLANSLNWSPDSIGLYSIAWGFNSRASGDDGATAFGQNTIAIGNNGATALGIFTTASGNFGATAFGQQTEASGNSGATAFGVSTIASGNNGATALGSSTTASGDIGATALGQQTEASGNSGATALGSHTVANGDIGATALGIGTTASGNNGATALGRLTTASGDDGATALGDDTTASGDNGATASGRFTIASGNSGATALGIRSIASGNNGVTALGNGTTASGNNGATALGDDTTASGNNGATALGSSTTASGNFGATALGDNTIATGNSCTVVGLYNDTIVAATTNISSTSPIFIVGNGNNGTNRSNAMVVRKDGSVGVGTDASRGQLSIKQRTNGDNEGLRLIDHNSDIAWEIRHTGSGDNLRFRAFDEDNNTDHTVEIRRSDGAYLMNSDRRLKKNIEYMDHMLPLITAIQPTQYHWIKDKNEEKTPSLGVIAQDLELLFPQAVHTNEDGFKMVNYDALGVLAIQAVKEQQDLISEMKDQISEMKELIQGHTKLIQKLTDPRVSGDE